MSALTEEQWREVFAEPGLMSPKMWEIFATIYAQPNHQGFAGELGKIMGYDGKNTSAPLNASVGKLGKKLLEKYDLKVNVRQNGKVSYWRNVFDGENLGHYFLWKMRPELVRAFSATDYAVGNNYPDEITFDQARRFQEGSFKKILVNSYERDPQARQECINHYGVVCMVCDFDFGAIYGELGKDYIHVHHLVPLSTLGGTYSVDPIKDLRPVCPNCHAMLHRGAALLTIKDLKTLMAQQSKGANDD